MINVLVKDTNEVVGFPDTTDLQTIEGVVKGDAFGEITQAKPNWYKDKIQPALEASGMDIFQPKFVGAKVETDAYTTALRGFGRGVSFGVLDPSKVSDDAARAEEEHRLASGVGEAVGSLASIAATAGLTSAAGLGKVSLSVGKYVARRTGVGVVGRMAAGAVGAGGVGALYGFLKEGVQQFDDAVDQGKFPDMVKVGGEALKNAGIFAAYGATGSAFRSVPIGSSAVAGLAYSISKMEGASEQDALLNAAVMGVFHFIATPRRGAPKTRLKEYTQEDIIALEQLDAAKAANIKTSNPLIHDQIAVRAAKEHTLSLQDLRGKDNLARDAHGNPISINNVSPFNISEKSQLKIDNPDEWSRQYKEQGKVNLENITEGRYVDSEGQMYDVTVGVNNKGEKFVEKWVVDDNGKRTDTLAASYRSNEPSPNYSRFADLKPSYSNTIDPKDIIAHTAQDIFGDMFPEIKNEVQAPAKRGMWQIINPVGDVEWEMSSKEGWSEENVKKLAEKNMKDGDTLKFREYTPSDYSLEEYIAQSGLTEDQAREEHEKYVTKRVMQGDVFAEDFNEDALDDHDPVFSQIYKAMNKAIDKGLDPITVKDFNQEQMPLDPEKIIVDPRLLLRVNQVQNELGKKITISSGFRTKEYNELLKSQGYKVAEMSVHKFGRGADIKIAGTGLTHKEVVDAARKAGLDVEDTTKTPAHVHVEIPTLGTETPLLGKKAPVRTKLPPHLQKVVDKANGFTKTDVTPNGYGPDRALRERGIEIFRGENTSSENRGKGGIGYYSLDKEFARQFTQTGKESEVRRRSIDPLNIYDAREHGKELPSANDEASFDQGMADAKAKGFKAFRLTEGKGSPDSIYVFDKKAFDAPEQSLQERLPEFKNTEEALAYGRENAGNPDIVKSLHNQYESGIAKINELRAKSEEAAKAGDMKTSDAMDSEGYFLAQKNQLYREAFQAAEEGTGEQALNARAWQKTMPTEPTTDKRVNKSQIVKFVEDNFNVAVRGKATKRMGKAAGTYAVDKNLIRLKKWGELEVLAHESAHAISEDIRDALSLNGIRQILPPAIEKVAADELKALDYDPMARRTEEGFAEYLRHWLTRTGETAKAPEFDKFFNGQFMKDHPEFGKNLVKLREMFDTWYGQGAENRVLQQIDKTGEHTTKLKGVMEKVAKAREWFVQKFVNDLYTIEKIENIVRPEGQANVRPTQSPSQLAKYARAKSGAIARTFVLEGAVDEVGNKIGKSLKEALDPIARKDVDKFMTYAVARRARLYHERGFESGFDKNDINYVIEKYKNPEWDKVIDDVTVWSNHLLDWVVRAGGLGQAEAMVIRELNPIYIPFKRAFSNELKVTQGGGRMVNQGAAVKSIKGSGRPIINPIESMIAQAGEMINKAQKLRVARALASLANEKDAGGFITEVPAPKTAHEVDVKDALLKLADMGVMFKDLDISKVDPDAMLTFFENKPVYNGKDNIVSIWINGKRRFFELHPELYEALNGIDPLRVGPVMRILGGFSRLVRLGATQLKASFSLIRNPFRDAFSYAVFSNRPGATIFDPIRGVYKDVTAKEGDLAYRFKSMGGEMSSMMGYDRAASMHAYDLLLDEKLRGLGGKSLKIAKHPIDTLRQLLQIPELGPRIAELENTYNRVRKEHPDWTDEDAFIAAFNDAQDVTVNFTRSGAWGRQINEAAAFFNASMQGSDKLVRSIKDHPVRTIVKGAAYLSTLAVWSYMANKDKEWYQNLPPAYKYNNIFIETPAGVVRLPIPFELGTIFYSALQSGMDYAATHDKEYLDGFLKNLTGQLPDPIPTAFQPLIDVGTNRNFLGQPIESEGMKFDPVEDRKRDNTSKAAEHLSAGFRAIGFKDLSPVEMDYLLNAYSGGMTKNLNDATTAVDKLSQGNVKPEDIPVLADVMLHNKNNPTRQLNAFFSDYETLSQKHHAKTLTPEEAGRYKVDTGIYAKLVGQGKHVGLFKQVKMLKDAKDEAGVDGLLKLERELLASGGYQ